MPTAVSIDDQIKEVNRELHMRLKVYPNLIGGGKLKRKDANAQYNALLAVKRSLMRLHEIEYGKQAALQLGE